MNDMMVDAAPARNHVQQLIKQGMTQQAICRAADVTPAALSMLLHGQYVPGRPPQRSIHAPTADRLLAVQFQAPTLPGRAEPRCAPGARFEAVGYRAGRCADCGQVAPVHRQGGTLQLLAHPRMAADSPQVAVPAAVADPTHPDCGTPRGNARHRRENTPVCEPCAAARRGYEQGLEVGIAKGRKEAYSNVPAALGQEVVTAMRAFLHRRPYPQLRQLAATVVRIADAELCADEGGRAAA
jgi:hypothetical protein